MTKAQQEVNRLLWRKVQEVYEESEYLIDLNMMYQALDVVKRRLK